MEKLPLIASKLSIYEYPKHVPGYTGYCPEEKFKFGQTYGNSTASWYNDYRHSTLSNSQERHGRGGDKHIPFPVYYQNAPSSVVGTTTRSHRRWESAEKYSLHNQSSNCENLRNFKLGAEDHREHYKDHTGMITRNEEFLLPKISYQTSPAWKQVGYP